MRANPAGARSDEAKTPQPGEANSHRVLEAARHGDRAAIDRLLGEARPRLLALALRVLGDADEAEDAVQDALVKVWQKLYRFEGRSAFSTWLHRIAVNAALDRRRRRPAVAAAELDERRAFDQRPSSETPERLYARAEAGVVVERALGRLSPAHGETLRLRELEGESYSAIADVTRCPVGTVMSRLHHARRNLARELGATAAGQGDLEALHAA